MNELENLTISSVFSIMLVFCRIGSTIMVLPGLGDAYVNMRTRLLFSMASSLVIFPSISNLPAFPSSPSALFLILIIEIIIGIFLGVITRILLSATHVMGVIIASQSGLGSALLFDPTQNTQGAMVGNFLGMIAVLLLFLTDMHHVLIKGMIDSYSLFLPGKFPISGDHAEYITKTLSSSFDIAIKIASPHLVISILILIGGGVMGRLMPSLQIFFLLTPVQMLISFFLIIATLSSSMMWYIDYIHNNMVGFLAPK